MNPIMGIPQCFGEEFAWRGYLLPKLAQLFNRRVANIFTNILWGLWHAPIIMTGFNYGTSSLFSAVLAQIILCMVLGNIFSFLFFKTKSICPVVLAHASINAIDKFTPQNLFTDQSNNLNLFIGPNLVGLIGGVGLIITSIICLNKLSTK